MSDLGKTIAHFLAKHQGWVDSKNLGYYRTEYVCQCGGTYWAGEHPEDPAYEIAHAQHQAEALAPVIRAARAEAWQEGFKQGGPMHDVNYDDPDAHRRNPYKEAP